MVDHQALAQLLAYAALIAATAEYCEILKRRQTRRQLEADRRMAAETGLYGLVRVIATDSDH